MGLAKGEPHRVTAHDQFAHRTRGHIHAHWTPAEPQNQKSQFMIRQLFFLRSTKRRLDIGLHADMPGDRRYPPIGLGGASDHDMEQQVFSGFHRFDRHVAQVSSALPWSPIV